MKFKNAKFIDTITYCLSFEMSDRLNDKFCAYPETGYVSHETWIPTKCLKSFNEKQNDFYASDKSNGFDGRNNFRVEVIMDADKVRPIKEVKKILLDHLNDWIKENL